MGKHSKAKRSDKSDRYRELQKAAKKERKRQEKAKAKLAQSERKLGGRDERGREFFAMCDKKRSYNSEIDAMMAAAHSRSGDSIRWYRCPYAPARKPHWHLTKMSEEAFERQHPKEKGKDVYNGIDVPCFVVASNGAAYPYLVFESKLDALKWAAKNKTFSPIEDGDSSRKKLDKLGIRNYAFSKSGVLCVDTDDAVKVMSSDASRIWKAMESSKLSRSACREKLALIRKNHRRIHREEDMDAEHRKFLKKENGKK